MYQARTIEILKLIEHLNLDPTADSSTVTLLRLAQNLKTYHQLLSRIFVTTLLHKFFSNL